MDNKKRAIIFDMDETLEHIIYHEMGEENGNIMVLRPHLDELISKLKETKKQGVDVILSTLSMNEGVERFFTLKPELREVFDKVLTRDNKNEWKKWPEDSVEYKAIQEYSDHNRIYIGGGKPVTALGYDFVLFIDDNRTEGDILEVLFKITQGKLEKDVTYFSGFYFCGGKVFHSEMLKYNKLANQSPELSQKLKSYIELEKNDPGCLMMCSVIDTFMNKEFTPGLTLLDEEYSVKYEKEFKEQVTRLSYELEDLACELVKENRDELYKLSDSERQELDKYFATDKQYPFEGMEVGQTEAVKRDQLGELIQTAVNLQKKLTRAQQLEIEYSEKESKEL